MARKGHEGPTRKFGPLHSSISGRVRTEDKATLVAESSLEHQWLTVLEYEASVSELSTQSVKVEYTSAGRTKAAHPDIKAVFAFGDSSPQTVVYEVKAERRLRRDWEVLRPKLKEVTSHCRAQGWRFKLITERLIETPYVRNAVFLRQYRKYRDDPEVAALGQVIANALAAEGTSTPTTP